MNANFIIILIQTAIPYLLIAIVAIGLVRLALEKIIPTTAKQKQEYREFVHQERIREARQLAGLDQPKRRLKK